MGYLQGPIIDELLFLVLTSRKFLETLGSGIGTGSVFCHSFSFSNHVKPFPSKSFITSPQPCSPIFLLFPWSTLYGSVLQCKIINVLEKKVGNNESTIKDSYSLSGSLLDGQPIVDLNVIFKTISSQKTFIFTF